MVGNNVSFTQTEKLKGNSIQIYKPKKFFVPEEGKWITLKLSASAIRTINKKGISAVLKDLKRTVKYNLLHIFKALLQK